MIREIPSAGLNFLVKMWEQEFYITMRMDVHFFTKTTMAAFIPVFFFIFFIPILMNYYFVCAMHGKLLTKREYDRLYEKGNLYNMEDVWVE